MKIKVIIHQAEEGGYWAEVPAISGCFTQGDSWEELIKNIYEAVEACLSVDVEKIKIKPSDKILDIAIWKLSTPPIYGNKSLKKSLLKAVIKLAGIKIKTNW